MNTSKLKLPLLASNQAQKEVTHNEALIKLECFVQSVALSRTLIPHDPSEGDLVIKEDQLAHYINGAWEYYELFDGFECWVLDEKKKIVLLSSTWLEVAYYNFGVPPAPLID